MVIHISHLDEELRLEARDDLRVFESEELNAALFAFTVISRGTDVIKLAIPPGKLVESVEYITETLTQVGVEVTLSEDIDQAFQSLQQEQDIIGRYREGFVPHILSNITSCPDMKRTLLDHQVRGLNQGLAVENFAEFSVQGSGKTTVALSAFSTWRERGEISKLMVIGPLSSFVPWEDEISESFVDDLVVLKWSGSIARRVQLVEEFNEADVVLCSYDTARMDVDKLTTLIGNHPTMLVLDESHYIKTARSARSDAAHRLAPFAKKRWIMSGTPAPHSLQDLWAQFQFLWPTAGAELLGNEQQFFALATSENPAKQLRTKLQPFYHRTTQSELGLPDPITHSISLGDEYVSVEQRKIIKLLELKIAQEARNQLPSITDQQILDNWRKARIIRLLQAASNPGLLINPNRDIGKEVTDVDTNDLTADISRFALKQLIPAKIRWAVEKAKELVSEGQKVVIWSWWVNNLHYLDELLQEHNPLLIYGAVRPFSRDEDDEDEASRETNIRLFKQEGNDYPILIANPAAAAESISLHQVCHNAIYVDRSFNCGQWLQSKNRIHRVNLPEGAITNYWIPFIDCAVERSVDSRLQSREAIMYEFLGDDSLVSSIDWGIEESYVSDNAGETESAFGTILQEIPVNRSKAI